LPLLLARLLPVPLLVAHLLQQHKQSRASLLRRGS
jgi:hypothetical protein